MRIQVLICALILAHGSLAQTEPIKYIPALVDFENKLQTWDGFGFNYVETCQTRDYDAYRQDYGGFSLLSEEKKQEIIQLVYGTDGLDVDIIKMFLDPWHQTRPGGPFQHERTQGHMLYFAKEGTKVRSAAGKQIDIITTLYGPPAWATVQDSIGGRDFNPEMTAPLINYMLEWCRHLKEDQQLNVRYLSIHNEGEDFYRWNFDEGTQRLEKFDYNMYWPPELVNEIVLATKKEIDARGMDYLGVTNGEPSNWTRFYNWGYARSLADSEAVDAIGILTTHGFINGDYRKLSYSNANGMTTQLLRSKRPGLKTWITSMAWGSMDTVLPKMIWEHIYIAGVNAIIPWAGIQDPAEWIDGDQLGNGIVVKKDGTYEVTKGYYVYKQLTQAGHKGMSVVHTSLANPQANIIAFAGGDTDYPDAFVVTSNVFIWGLPFEIDVKGSRYSRFRAYRSTDSGEERYQDIGTYDVVDGKLVYDAPQGSVTTFIGIK